MHNAADEKIVKDAKQKARNDREQELDDIRDLLKRPAGVRFFRRMMNDGKVFSTSFTGNSYTFFNEGARNLVLQYFSDVCAVSPEKVAELMLKPKEEDAADIQPEGE